MTLRRKLDGKDQDVFKDDNVPDIFLATVQDL